MPQKAMDSTNGHDFCLGTIFQGPDAMLPGDGGIEIIALSSGRRIESLGPNAYDGEDGPRNAHQF
jgi:hypothetical protein